MAPISGSAAPDHDRDGSTMFKMTYVLEFSFEIKNENNPHVLEVLVEVVKDHGGS